MTPERYQQICELFQAALELEADRQFAFLEQACCGDRALFEQVNALLAKRSNGDSWIDRPALEIAVESLAASESQSWIGRQVHHYRVSALLGAGGMGQVYRARDTRLDREVAIKVLPVAYSMNSEWLRRFEQEARAAGQLNHPNVLTVHDVGVWDGAPYIVAELLEGEELRALLRRGSVPQRRAVEIAQQVASGLVAAHAKGIIHRDLKPENIFLTGDGRVKILDFGLAKLKAPPAGKGADIAPSVGTTPGVIMGTVSYLAPEQVSGHESDERTDIFVLGVILYEMLSGVRPFTAESSVEVMHAILKEDAPDLVDVNPKVSGLLGLVVQRCLGKKPEQRFQSAGDLRFAIEALSFTSRPRATGEIAMTPALPRFSRRRLLQLTPVALLAAGTAWQYIRRDYWWPSSIENAAITPLTDLGAEAAAISPDGKFVAFLSDMNGPHDVWVVQIGVDGAGIPSNLTKGLIADLKNPEVRNLGFSRDGKSILFWVRGEKLTTQWTVPTIGGTPGPYWDGPELDRSIDGRTVYHTNADGDPLYVTKPNEMQGDQIHVDERGVHNHFPLWSPDADFIYFTKGFPPNEMDIWRIRPTGGSVERITMHNSRVAYPTFLDERTILYTSMDANGLGPWLYGIDVEHRVSQRVLHGAEQYTSIAASDSGRLVATVANPEAHLWQVPIAEGIAEESAASRIEFASRRGLCPRTGPNYMLYLSSNGGVDGIWKRTNGKAAEELWNAAFGRVLGGPAIAPDGSRIAFAVQKAGQSKLYLMNSSGTARAELPTMLRIRGAPAWPPSGEWLTVAADQGKGTEGLFTVPLHGGQSIRLVREEATNPLWSPDGRFLVFSPRESGTWVTLKAITADGRDYRIPEVKLSRGANRVAFLPGSSILVVLQGEFWHKNFWSVDLKTGKRRQLTRFNPGFRIEDFDISSDGKQIIFGRLKENSYVVTIDLPQR